MDAISATLDHYIYPAIQNHRHLGIDSVNSNPHTYPNLIYFTGCHFRLQPLNQAQRISWLDFPAKWAKDSA
jgi:hypothetical protein